MRAILTSAVLIAIGAGMTVRLEAADKPPLPANRDKPGTAASDGKRHLADNAISYEPLESSWIEAVKSKTPTRDAFVSKGHDAMVAIEVLPASMTITPELASGMIKKIRENRKANGNKVIQEPTLEKDERFIIRIREKYQVKDKVADQLHLYRQVGPRVVLVTINSLGGEEAAKGHHEAGEKACLSAEFAKKSGK
jgi:hypothetical protein